MNNKYTGGLKFCFISNANYSYLTEYIHLSLHDFRKDFSFKNINLSDLRSYQPDIIVIDEYFKDNAYASIINSIKLNFKHTTIFLLSPEYANYNSTIQSANKEKHVYSNFCIDVLKQIDNLSRNNSDNYLEAS
jgi:hypothetical protein